MEKIKIELIPNGYTNNGILDKGKAYLISGRIAGVCYNQEGYIALLNEPIEKSLARAQDTLYSQHHSVYEHINVTLNIKNLPKIIAMVLNNEKQFATSEKSARYTTVQADLYDNYTKREEELYNKWLNIFKIKIEELYPGVYKNFKIRTLAQENARYMVTVFMPTEMIYTVNLRQLNYIVSWMYNYIDNANYNDHFQKTLAKSMLDFIDELNKLNLLEKDFMTNYKERNLSLFKTREKEEYFGDVYTTNYSASFVALAQLQRHRTIHYEMDYTNDLGYYIPPILRDDPILVNEWLQDLKSVQEIYPLGKLLEVTEQGKYEDFILKCKERLCAEAQLETCNITKQTLEKYRIALEDNEHPLKDDIVNYTKGARCTFKDFTCIKDCKNSKGKRLVRKI